MRAQPRIAIVGTGPGGLTLARILHHNGVSATLFERDPSPSFRPQGGMLDMHPDTGQFALYCAGLTDAFQRIARYEDQGMRIYDKHGALRFESNDPDGDRPEVDRPHLRQMLLDSLPPDAIRWGHALREARAQPDGSVELRFQNGQLAHADLIVGADGAWSRIRPLVSPAMPIYTGVTFIELVINDADTACPELAALVGHGTMFALGDRKALIAQRNANARLRVCVALRAQENWDTAQTFGTISALRQKDVLTAHLEGWDEKLLQLIYKAGEEARTWPLYALPVGHCWKTRDGVTLLGDAAHLMSPFSGQGANLAMRDAADLALALLAQQDWRAAVRCYEPPMLARAQEAAIGADHAIRQAFSAQGLTHILKQMQQQQQPSPLIPT